MCPCYFTNHLIYPNPLYCVRIDGEKGFFEGKPILFNHFCTFEVNFTFFEIETKVDFLQNSFNQFFKNFPKIAIGYLDK